MAAVYPATFNRSLPGLWHGRSQAYAVAVLTVVIASPASWAVCVVFVRLPIEPDDGREGW